MRQDERRARGQSGRRDFHNTRTVHFPHNAHGEHELGSVAVTHKRGVLLEQICEAVGAEAYASGIGYVIVSEGLLRVEEQFVSVGFGRGGGGGIAFGASGQGHLTEHVSVVFGHDDFTDFAGEGASGVHGHLRLVTVGAVDDERESAVLRDGQLLQTVFEVGGGAVTGLSGTGVVIERHRGNGVHVDGTHARETVILIEREGGLRGYRETFVNFRGVARGQIDIRSRHKRFLPFCYRRKLRRFCRRESKVFCRRGRITTYRNRSRGGNRRWVRSRRRRP